jgi:MerR family transcriptional regulator, light-induced transcriptional regulator
MELPIEPCRGAPEHLAEIVRTLQTDIIPRLVSARRPTLVVASKPAVAASAVGAEEVAELARLALAPDEAPSRTYVMSRLGKGLAPETLYLEFLGPAAKCLGDLWEQDACDFTQVTVGLWRLQLIAHELAPLLQADIGPAQTPSHRVLLSPAPGEQHTLGIFMVSEFFLRAGWDVWGAPTATKDDLLRMVGDQWFDLVGLSSGCRARLDALATIIAKIRQASRNPRIGVMVGGPAFLGDPRLVVAVGADGTARDARHAPREAEMVLARLGPSSSSNGGGGKC